MTVDNVNANTLNIKETIKFLYALHIKRPITMNKINVNKIYLAKQNGILILLMEIKLLCNPMSKKISKILRNMICN